MNRETVTRGTEEGAETGIGTQRLVPSVIERMSRHLARGLSRRHFLSALGGALVGSGIIPLLPVDRRGAVAAAKESGFAATAQTIDDTQCDFWRYCALEGTLCTCCGGAVSACPPGSIPAPTAWIGSCMNPDDDEVYLVAYRDCCGTDFCSRCDCHSSEGEMPVYRPQLNGDITWCFGTDNQMTYSCTHSALLGKA